VIGSNTDFGPVYEDHVDRLYAFLAYRVADRATAEDLTQLTFERALRAWAQFDPQRGSELTWLVAIARNVLADHFRRAVNRFPALDADALLDSELPILPGPEAQHAGSPELVAALAQLAEREREVIALRFGGDLDAAGIAHVLGMSPANVHQILSRSLRRLRTLLEQKAAAARALAAA
jgi:RNA polymerase sigma factor (sigma-70 family)